MTTPIVVVIVFFHLGITPLSVVVTNFYYNSRSKKFYGVLECNLSAVGIGNSLQDNKIYNGLLFIFPKNDYTWLIINP